MVELGAAPSRAIVVAYAVQDADRVLSKYFNGGACTSSRAKSIRTYIVDDVLGRDSEDMDILCDTVVHWLTFAHLGNVRARTPGHWVLAWAGVEFRPEFVQSGVVLVDLLWEADPEVSDWELVAGAFSVATDAVIGIGTPVQTAANRLRRMAAEVLPVLDWHLSGCRDRAFDFLETHVNACAPRKRVCLSAVEALENRHCEGPVPWDLRRMLLQIGDLGSTNSPWLGFTDRKSFVGGCVLSYDSIRPGAWPWTVPVRVLDSLFAIALDDTCGPHVLDADLLHDYLYEAAKKELVRF